MLLVKLYLKAHSVESIIGWELLLPIAEKINYYITGTMLNLHCKNFTDETW